MDSRERAVKIRVPVDFILNLIGKAIVLLMVVSVFTFLFICAAVMIGAINEWCIK